MSANLPALPGKRRDAPEAKAIRVGIGRQLMVGGLAAATLILVLGGMAAMIDFAGAVVASGRLVVSTNVKKIQHQTGGTVTRIMVEDGDKVKAGDLLIQLDPTLASANLGIVEKGLAEAMARKARLEAERAGFTAIKFPADLLAKADRPEVSEVIAVETGAFESRLAARDGQRAQLRKKIAELEQQLVGIKAQEDAVRRQITLTQDEVTGLRELRKKDLVSTDRMSDAERRLAQLDGQLGQLIAGAAQTGAEIAQAELQILQIDQDMRSEASRDLAEAGSRINELSERLIAAEDQLRKLDIRAPINGTVYQLTVHTVGGVVSPGEAIMMIVPENDLLVVEGHIDPSQVDRVHPKQEAVLRFSTLGGRTTPEYIGTVETISPDLVVDQRTGAGYYVARVSVPQQAVDDLGAKMVPGVPVEVFIGTGPRTVLSYLVKPLGDQIMHTFRER
ncbi:MAG TPA: HlyD family type I secretion periplasmic adaptor subunit [Bauldia sp.]|nr:HlyD family type I secretion periplasmic adaptor subunit [Bauldia sp.]